MDLGPRWREEFYGNLKAFDASLWPMTCRGCGTTFNDNDDYIAKTAGSSDATGLGSIVDDNGVEQVGLFRTCLCNARLVGRFKDRRDNSPEGQLARAQFERLLEMLIETGMAPKFARQELLKMVRGEHNEILKIL